MKLDPRHLELLAAVVRHGGVTEGAAALGKSQPSVSRTLAALERRLRQSLFQPGRRPLRPTELGQALAEKGEVIAQAARQASETVERFRQGRGGAVRIGGTPFFMDGVVTGIVADFQGQTPDVRIEQSYGYAGDLLEQLLDGRIDLAVCPLKPQEVPPALAFTPILPGRNVVACRKGHPLLRRRTVEAREMFAYPWIAPPAQSPLYADLRLTLDRMGARDFKISFSGGSLSSVLTVLTGSDALTILPYSVVFQMRRRHDIAALRVRIDHPDRALGLVVRNADAQAPALARVHAFIANRFRSLAETILHSEKTDLWRGQ